MTAVLRTALIGCGNRGRVVYLPVLATMGGHFRVVAVCDPDPDRRAAAAAATGATAYADLGRMLAAARPDACVVCVTPPPDPANGRVLRGCLDAGVPVLAETPIALTAAEADEIVVAADGRVVEIAENYVGRPRERFMQALLGAGVFGEVTVAHADLVGHGYHGVAMLRAYLGRHRHVVEVRGDRHRFAIAPHVQRNGQVVDEELWQFGVLLFDNGARGVLEFTTLAYHSPLRPRADARMRFLATRGSGSGPSLTALQPDGATRPVAITPVEQEIGGIVVPAALTAPGTDLIWENPLRALPLADGDQHSMLTVGLQMLALHRGVTEGAAPEYGPAEARYDRVVDLALTQSWDRREPVAGRW